MLHDHLVDVGFKQSVHDPCIYTRYDAILAVHVDDIIVATDGVQKMKQVKRDIAGPFAVKDLGELKHFLGVTMNQGQDGTWIGQLTYTKNVLEKYNMQDSKAVATPVDASQKLTDADDGTCDSETVDQEMHQSAVGNLLYLSTWTRPDITYAVSNVSKFCAKPMRKHWNAVKCILRYLRGTLGLRSDLQWGSL